MNTASLIKLANETIASVPTTPETEHFLASAMAQVGYMSANLALAEGQPFAWRPELKRLATEINDHIVAIERRLAAPIPEGLSEDECEAEMIRRDEATDRVNAARAVGLNLLVDLSLALHASAPNGANLKAV